MGETEKMGEVRGWEREKGREEGWIEHKGYEMDKDSAAATPLSKHATP